jgi:hypothetical protein
MSNLFDYSRDKIIIYVRMRDEAMQLASILSCEAYIGLLGLGLGVQYHYVIGLRVNLSA